MVKDGPVQNPTITYLLIAAGLILAVLAVAAPGTGFLELIALSLLFTAGVAIFVYELAINAWALLVLLIGAILFVISIRVQYGFWLLRYSHLWLGVSFSRARVVDTRSQPIRGAGRFSPFRWLLLVFGT
jgi:prepilin signal peptidase PulO-like enzyme (type II secretory pathway)